MQPAPGTGTTWPDLIVWLLRTYGVWALVAGLAVLCAYLAVRLIQAGNTNTNTNTNTVTGGSATANVALGAQIHVTVPVVINNNLTPAHPAPQTSPNPPPRTSSHPAPQNASAHIQGMQLVDAWNVGSFTDSGVGLVTLTWATPFVGSYHVEVTMVGQWSRGVQAIVSARADSSVLIRFEKDGRLVDPQDVRVSAHY